MNSASNGKTKRGVKALGLAAAVISAGLIAFPSPALADHDHGRKLGHRKQVTRRVAPRYTYTRVPRRFVPVRRQAYRLNYVGRAYYPAHRHYHEIYRFPVFVGGRVVYQPYAYCGDLVFLERPAPLPRLAFGLSFGETGGFFFSGYFGD